MKIGPSLRPQRNYFRLYVDCYRCGISQIGEAIPNTFHSKLCRTRRNLGGEQAQKIKMLF